MSFRSLLFCPDENAARLVTQVLSELDFTVELAHEPFAAVQRLSEEQFHALVVDCQNEQDASLLFKAARNSAHNSGSLSVAVVEGQAGVAKAFRIGANLVLTKPVNVEQSKSTLRVARGLLKKAQPKPGIPSTAGNDPVTPARTSDRPPTQPAAFASSHETSEPSAPARAAVATSTPSMTLAKAAVNPPAQPPVVSVPFSGLVLENEPEPVTEAADAAVLESLPGISGKRTVETATVAQFGHAEPIAASTSGQAAAAALAPETKHAFRTAGAGPMVTNEPITSTVTVDEPGPTYEPEPVSAPTFSALESAGSNSGGRFFLKIAAVLALLVGGGYFAWQQPKVRDYAQKVLHRSVPAQSEPAQPDSTINPEPAQDSSGLQVPVESTPSPAPSQEPAQTAEAQGSSTPAQDSIAFPPRPSRQERANAPETIEVQELPIARDPGKTTVAPKPQPIVVRNSAPAGQAAAAQLAPPPMNAVSDAASQQLPNLAPTDVELPKPAPGVVRISQGVSQGLLVKKVQPVYPSIAQQFHREGSVQLLATIDKYGAIKKVQTLSGDPMLTKAAADAVKQWEYRPYLLNGQPVEIETQITILFKAQH